MAPAPAWLYAALGTAAAPPAPRPAPALSDPAAAASAYAEAALNAEVLIVLGAGEGTRNDTLHKSAVKVGGLVGAGALRPVLGYTSPRPGRRRVRLAAA